MSVGLVQTYRAFACNNAWANHRLLRACAELSPAEFEAELTGFLPSLQRTLKTSKLRSRSREGVLHSVVARRAHVRQRLASAKRRRFDPEADALKTGHPIVSVLTL
jgi:hypothetical protein